MIRFTVYETPVGKGRGRTPPGGGRPYTPAKTRTYERRVAAACLDAMRRGRLRMFDEPVVLDITIRLRPPTSVSKVKRAAMLAGDVVPTKKPDCSNVLKAIEDALNKVAYRDDALITRITVNRLYADSDGADVVVESYASARERERANVGRGPRDIAPSPLATGEGWGDYWARQPGRPTKLGDAPVVGVRGHREGGG